MEAGLLDLMAKIAFDHVWEKECEVSRQLNVDENAVTKEEEEVEEDKEE